MNKKKKKKEEEEEEKKKKKKVTSHAGKQIKQNWLDQIISWNKILFNSSACRRK